MGFLARLYADGRGSANAEASTQRVAAAVRVAEEAGGAEAPDAQGQAAWEPEPTRTLPEAGPAFREGDDPIAAGSDPDPAAEPAVPEEETRSVTRPAGGASLGADGGEAGQARYSPALSGAGPDGKSAMRPMPATRSDAIGANPASAGAAPGPRAVAPLAGPASPGPVAATAGSRDAAGNGGAKDGERGGEKGGVKDGEKKAGKGPAESRQSDPVRSVASGAMNPVAAPASRPGAAAPSGSPEREAGAVSAGPAVPAAKKSIPAASGPASGGNSLDTALGAMARAQQDRTRPFGAFGSQGNLEGTRNPERTSRPEPAQGPRVVIGSLEIRVEALPPAPAAPQESAAAARSRSYRMEW